MLKALNDFYNEHWNHIFMGNLLYCGIMAYFWDRFVKLKFIQRLLILIAVHGYAYEMYKFHKARRMIEDRFKRYY